MDLSSINWLLLLASLIVAATPILLAAVGELVVEKAGVLNLGVEGMMIMGAVCGFIIAVETGSAPLGFVAAAAGGALLSMLFGGADAVLDVEPSGDGPCPDTVWSGAVGVDGPRLHRDQGAGHWQAGPWAAVGPAGAGHNPVPPRRDGLCVHRYRHRGMGFFEIHARGPDFARSRREP